MSGRLQTGGTGGAKQRDHDRTVNQDRVLQHKIDKLRR